MVTPSRAGEVDSLGVRVMTGEEGTTNAESASSRDTLSDRNLKEKVQRELEEFGRFKPTAPRERASLSAP